MEQEGIKYSESGKVFRRLLRYAAPYKGRIIISMIASLGVAGADAAGIRLIQPFVDRVIVAADPSLVNIVPIVVIALAALKGFSRYVQEYFIKTAGQMVIQDVRNDIFSHSMFLSMRFFTRMPAGALMSRILNDVGVMQNSIAEVVVDYLRETVTLVGLIAIAFYMDWKLTAVAFAIIPVAGWPASVIGRKIKSYSRRGQGAMGNLTRVLEQGFSGIKVIKAFGTERRENEKFRTENASFYSLIRKTIKYDAASSPVVEILASLGVAGVLWYGMHRVISGETTPGELTSVLTAILAMYTPVKRLTRVNNRMQRAVGAAERVFEVLEQRPEIEDTPGALPIERVQGEVHFDHVNFSYDEEPVLRDVSLRASPGEVIALVGPSGSGKTTLAGLLCRFYDPNSGQILLDGRDLRQITLESLKRNLALVDQESFLFNDTIGNNIRYGRPKATDAEVEEAARLAYADEFIRRLPEGYETSIGDRGVRLSGGQRQRICIARAILQDAPILILDEATSALDTESEAIVQKALANLMRNRTTFVIAHRLSTIMHADRIVVLEEGRICQMGTHQELLDLGGLYRKLHGMQFQEQTA